MNRSIQVEGAFGVLKNDYEFQRFLLRGKTKVKLKILLLCMGYNLNKLHSKIQKERTGLEDSDCIFSQHGARVSQNLIR